MTQFQNYRAPSFDCYGTLIDWKTGIPPSTYTSSCNTLRWRAFADQAPASFTHPESSNA